MSKAIVIDDHQLFSSGLSHLVKDLDGIEGVECYTDPQTAMGYSEPDNIKLVICDLYIPGFDMFVWFKRIRVHFPNGMLAVVSSSISRTDRKDSLAVGAHLYLEKHADPELVRSNLSNLLKSLPIEDNFLDRTARDAQDVGLTQKQIDILVHLARGMALKEIANRFEISSETVKSHLSRIYDIIGVSGRSAASNWARRHGLL